MPEEKKLSDYVDYDAVFDPNLTVEEYTEKLDEALIEAGVGMVERRMIIRQKVQEFRDKVRTTDIRKRT